MNARELAEKIGKTIIEAYQFREVDTQIIAGLIESLLKDALDEAEQAGMKRQSAELSSSVLARVEKDARAAAFEECARTAERMGCRSLGPTKEQSEWSFEIAKLIRSRAKDTK